MTNYSSYQSRGIFFERNDSILLDDDENDSSESSGLYHSSGNNLPYDVVHEFRKRAQACQDAHYHSIGRHNHRVIESSVSQRNILQRQVGMALYGAPEIEEARSNEYTGYKTDQVATINKIVNKIIELCTSFRLPHDEIHYTTLMIIGIKHGDREYFQSPMFKIFRDNSDNRFVLIDANANRTYGNMDDFLKNHTFSNSLICYPRDARYSYLRQYKRADIAFVTVTQPRNVVVRMGDSVVSMYASIIDWLYSVVPKQWHFLVEKVKEFGIFLYDVGSKLINFGLRHKKAIFIGGVMITVLSSMLFASFQSGVFTLNELGILSTLGRIINKQGEESNINAVEGTQLKSLLAYFCNVNMTTQSLFTIIDPKFWNSLLSIKATPHLLGGQATRSVTDIVDIASFFKAITSRVSNIRGFNEITEMFQQAIRFLASTAWPEVKEIFISTLTVIKKDFLNMHLNAKRLVHASTMRRVEDDISHREFIEKMNGLYTLQNSNQQINMTNLLNDTQEDLDGITNTLSQRLNLNLDINDIIVHKKFVMAYVYKKTVAKCVDMRDISQYKYEKMYRDTIKEVQYEAGSLVVPRMDSVGPQPQMYSDYQNWMDELKTEHTGLLLLTADSSSKLYMFDSSDNNSIAELAYKLLNSRKFNKKKLDDNNYGVYCDNVAAFITICGDDYGFAYVYEHKKPR